VIEIDKVSKWYGSFEVLKDCSTTIAKGEVMQLLNCHDPETTEERRDPDPGVVVHEPVEDLGGGGVVPEVGAAGRDLGGNGPGDPGVEFHLGHGDWIRLLRANGFAIEDLVELIRNIPLLLQLFFWYFAVLKAMPAVRNSLALPFEPRQRASFSQSRRARSPCRFPSRRR